MYLEGKTGLQCCHTVICRGKSEWVRLSQESTPGSSSWSVRSCSRILFHVTQNLALWHYMLWHVNLGTFRSLSLPVWSPCAATGRWLLEHQSTEQRLCSLGKEWLNQSLGLQFGRKCLCLLSSLQSQFSMQSQNCFFNADTNVLL